MLINFIGFSFLCGIGLGCFIVLVWVVFKKATEQRTKWVILGSAFITTSLAIAITVYLLLLPRPEEQIRAQLDMIPKPRHSSLLFEHAYISSSAAGDCSSTTMDRWFGLGTDNNEQPVIEWYSDQLIDRGWQRFENTAWQKQDSNSLFRIRIEVFEDTTSIDSQQWFYQISNDELKQVSDYPASYVLKASVQWDEARARCLGQ